MLKFPIYLYNVYMQVLLRQEMHIGVNPWGGANSSTSKVWLSKSPELRLIKSVLLSLFGKGADYLKDRDNKNEERSNEAPST